MKRYFCILFITLFFAFSFYSLEKIPKENAPTEYVSKGGYAQVPEAKRPKPIDAKKAQEAAEKDENSETDEKNRNTIMFGTSTEVGELLSTLIKNEDPRYTEEIYDLFQEKVHSYYNSGNTEKKKVFKPKEQIHQALGLWQWPMRHHTSPNPTRQ